MKRIYSLFMALALVTSLGITNAQVSESDSLALVDFYNATGGENWTDQGNWLTGDVSTWLGVTVDTLDVDTDYDSIRVTELGISLNNLSGTIPSTIGNLTELNRLEVKGDEDTKEYVDVTGSIPAELWNCTKIYRLQIKFTKITGEIPTTGLSNMTALEEINFQGTKLGVEIPEEIFNLPSLTKAYLHQSDFIGDVPESVKNATGLTRLYLHENKLDSVPFVDIPVENGAKVNLGGNYFSFATVKPYHDASGNYAKLTDDFQYARAAVDTVVDQSSSFTINGSVEGGESYAWFKNDETIPVSTSADLSFTEFGLMDEGTYVCRAQSSLIQNFDIRTVYNITSDVDGFERDSLALVDFYNATGGANWTDQGNWLTGNVSTWLGVTVDTLDVDTDYDSIRVTELGIALNNLSGTIPATIGSLTELTRLEIKGDEDTKEYVDITGSIPAELWNCTKIYRLQIKFTKITGEIPTTGLSNMTALEEINFQGTKLGVEIPEEIFNLPSLTKAYLHQSDFMGDVPESVKNATGLTRLYLHENKLDSVPFVDIPAENSAKVNLGGNYFSFATVKPYHDASGNYAKLTDDFQYARAAVDTTVEHGSTFTINGSVEGGESYAWFKNEETAPVSTSADLTFDSFDYDEEGTYVCKAQSTLIENFDIRTVYNISDDVSGFELDSIALVDFYNATGGANWTDQGNWLTGDVSTWLGVTVDTLDADMDYDSIRVTELGISLNNLSGAIPASIGYLSELTRLEIKGDEDTKEYIDITGTIPAELWKCTKIYRLQIKFTKITGDIPTEGLSNMTALEEINFQGTKLASEIPEEIFNLPSLTKAYLHQSDFTGVVPESVKNATGLSRLYLQENKLEGPLPFVDIPAANNAKVNLGGNYFTFADVKQYHDSVANYAKLTDDFQFAQDTVFIDTAYVNDSVAFEFDAPGGEMFAWFKDDETTPASTDAVLSIDSVTTEHAGVYTCHVQSTSVANFEVLAVFVIKEVVDTTSVGINDHEQISFAVYPNPVKDILRINSESQIQSVAIFDITGKMIIEKRTANNNSIEIPVSGLNRGIYFVRVQSNGLTSTQKIIKK